MAFCYTLGAAAAALLLAGCGAPGEPEGVRVEEAWVRMPATPAQPGAAYFRIAGASEGTRLVDLTSPLARWVELHETREENGVSKMRQVQAVDFPSRGALVFEPGGRHAMLFGLSPEVKPGGTLPLTFSFNNAPPVTVEADVRSVTGESHATH